MTAVTKAFAEMEAALQDMNMRLGPQLTRGH